MHRTSRRIGWAAVLLGLALIAAACGGGASASQGGGLWVKIASPKDHAKVGDPFTVELQASVPIGDPSTGDHHVHLCVDGASCDTQYQLAYANTVQVVGLAPGTHTIEASLRNADHSDAGPTDTITVTVTGASTADAGASPGSTPASTPAPSGAPAMSGGTGGYGY